MDLSSQSSLQGTHRMSERDFVLIQGNCNKSKREVHSVIDCYQTNRTRRRKRYWTSSNNCRKQSMWLQNLFCNVTSQSYELVQPTSMQRAGLHQNQEWNKVEFSQELNLCIGWMTVHRYESEMAKNILSTIIYCRKLILVFSGGRMGKLQPRGAEHVELL